MKAFYIEGLFLPKVKSKKVEVEPFTHTIWAETAEDALREATESLQGGRWVVDPRIMPQSEEQRMRALGAPELPGLDVPVRKAKKRS